MQDSISSMDFALGETVDAIRETTARFAADRIAPLAAGIDIGNEFPRSLWPEMGALGLHGAQRVVPDRGRQRLAPGRLERGALGRHADPDPRRRHLVHLRHEAGIGAQTSSGARARPRPRETGGPGGRSWGAHGPGNGRGIAQS